ncbi:MAG: radical SAM protein [Desulfovibrionaceae bacterium]
MKIYLADLVYDTIKTNYVIPLNIAYVAAKTIHDHGKAVDVTLFKHPLQLQDAINDSPPDLIGLSNYSWNTNLNMTMLKLSRKRNPSVITVMGGPHIRPDDEGLLRYLTKNTDLNYYIPFEGEEPFSALVGNVLAGDHGNVPPGCATLQKGSLRYTSTNYKKSPATIDVPSPYLSGLLDPFLATPEMIPLLETNRGCPFGCAYCTWGIAALSKVKQRDLEVVFKEIDYIAEHCAGQASWIFCDANFGMLHRDIEIAKKVREVMDRRGYPLHVTVWHAKNTSDRNIEIARILNDKSGYIAIQSTDPEVLKHAGRSNISVHGLKKHINYYKSQGMTVDTDILIGLPGESAQSHLNTLIEAFEIGFDGLCPTNIRLLPGSKYESDPYRSKYDVQTKYRPIFGCYGIYDGELVFEIEESVRATKDMSEEELDSFKIIHWMIFFCWSMGVFKPLLKYAHAHGINPIHIFHSVAQSENVHLRGTFAEMRRQSMNEWFNTEEDMIQHFMRDGGYEWLTTKFFKLIFLYIALVYNDKETIASLQEEIIRHIKENIPASQKVANEIDAIVDITKHVVCKDILQDPFSEVLECPAAILPYFLNAPPGDCGKTVMIQISRPKDVVSFCHFHLNQNEDGQFTLHDLTRFLEMDGIKMLTNRIQVVS